MRTLILDFDGTIADTSMAIFATVQFTLRHLNLRVPDERLVRQFIGLPLRDTFITAAGIEDEILLRECISVYRSRFNEICGTCIRLYPDVKEILEYFKEAGVILAVASSRGRESLVALLDTLGIAPLMDLVVGEQDVKAAKPAPDMVNLIVERTATAPNEALVVGDTVFDIRMGASAGVRTCGITYGNHSREKLQAERPDYLVDSFAELKTILLPNRL